nr:2-dehydro-3-deoxy-6-phosphogalactonate aldolase [Providencia huaxiensis]
MVQRFTKEIFIESSPFIAILRGLRPEKAIEVGKALYESGITYMEVPLNRPGALESIQLLKSYFQDKAVVGAGTVLTVKQVEAVKKAGGELIISPNMNESVIRHSKELGMISVPGVFTVTEAFNALSYGADALKFFPAESITPEIVKAMMAVLPTSIPYFMVGGINADVMQIQSYYDVGISGYGVGGGFSSQNFLLLM